MSTCECGFITENLPGHKDGELCLFLKKHKYGNVRGKDIVSCHKCGQKKMVCGLHKHANTCKVVAKKDITKLLKNNI